MEKSKDAFRTISEVAEWLDVPTHVLRFWESRFSQIKPVKRAGGRRYYRPSDMRVIGGVKVLLHDQGMTIRGVQKLFREQGIKHVSSHAPSLHGEAPDITAEVIEQPPAEVTAAPAPAARSTRDATPDPISEDASEAVAEPALFRHRSESAPKPETPFEAAAEVSEAKPAIPAVPNEFATDPADTDPAYAAKPGVAARLRMIETARLAAHRDVVENAVTRLRTLASRAS